MLLGLKLFWNNKKASWKGFWFKILFSSRKLQIGKNFRCETWPEINITQKGKVIIGDNVFLRRNVEFRAHQNSTLQLSGDNRIDRGVRFLASNNAHLNIGEGTRIGLYSVLNGGGSITVGKNVLISGFVYLQTSMHNHEVGVNIREQGFDHNPIVIEYDSWLGAHVVVLPGVTLKAGAIAGSNAVIREDVAKNTIVGGVPAKVIKTR